MRHTQKNELLLKNKIDALKWSQDWGVILVLFPFLLAIGLVNFYFILEKVINNIDLLKEYAINHSLYRFIIAVSFDLWFIFAALLLFFNFLYRRIKIWQYQREYDCNPDLWLCGTELNHKLETIPLDFGEAILPPLGFATIFLSIPVALIFSYEIHCLYLFWAIPSLAVFIFKLKDYFYTWLIPLPNVEIDYHPLLPKTQTRLNVFFTDNVCMEYVSVVLVCEEIRMNRRSQHVTVEYKDIYTESLFNNTDCVNNSGESRLFIEFSLPPNIPSTQKIYDTRIREEISIRWKIIIEQTYKHRFSRKLEYDLIVCDNP
jgi:hypothetical protein